MKTALRVAIAGMSVLAATGGLAQPAMQAPTVGDFQVKEINVAEIDTTHVKLVVDLSLFATQSATLENLRLFSFHLNGQSVFASPLNQEMVINKGTTVALPPVYITMLFRDLHTTEPLRRMIENQSVRIEGELVADVRLTLMEKLALHTQHPSVEIALNQEVPVTLGGTPLERNVALSILKVIDNGFKVKTVADKYIPGMQPQWIRDLQANARANLFAVESTYTLTKAGARYPVTSVHLGFRIAPAQVVTVAEAQAPWKYDAEFLGAVQSGAAKLEKHSLEILLRPVAQGDPLRLSARDFTVNMRGASEEGTLIPANGKRGKMKVLHRVSPTSLAVLTLHEPPTPPALAAASAWVAAQESWEQVAVFRVREDTATRKPSVEVIQLRARREGLGIRLSEPVDAAVFGSPIVTPEGVIGLVQDEQTGAFLPADLLAPATTTGAAQ
ncbi:MAG: hypothetical protein ABR990_10805 [Terracidiphilus sp.]|jgi:hypothetical protein